MRRRALDYNLERFRAIRLPRIPASCRHLAASRLGAVVIIKISVASSHRD